MYVNRKGTKFDVETLHKITKGITPRSYNTDNFLYVLDYPVWDYRKKALTPREVLDNRDKYPNHWKRILEADLSYPILITERKTVIDGYHRLLKAMIQNQTKINAVKVSDSTLQKAMKQ